MAGGELIRFYGTTGVGGASDGDSEPDTSLWLGKYRASQRLDELQSTLTSNQTAFSKHRFIDSARIGDGAQAHQLKWVLIQTGPAALSAARVMSFNTATGEFILDRPTTAIAQSGDYYAIFDTENVFPNVTAAQSSTGETRYRCIVVKNETGVTLTDARLRFIVIGLEPEQMGMIWNVVDAANFLHIPNESTSPLNDNGYRIIIAGDLFGAAPGAFQKPFLSMLPHLGNMTINTRRAMFLERVIPADAPYRASVAVLVLLESDTSGQDPDPLVGGAIMAFDIAGPTVDTELDVDRFVHVSGGCHMDGNLTSQATGAPISGRAVKFEIKAGDAGTLAVKGDPTDDYDTTDEDGDVRATYQGTTNPAHEGDDATLRMIVGAGDEVGDP